MRLNEAEKLLGGYATGTLTEAERQSLFATALEHQDLFDALMDEEALRELLSDPMARAQLLAALTPAEGPKLFPFWRRTSVLGAAASLLVASLASVAYFRNPSEGPPAARQAAATTPPAMAANPATLPTQATPPSAKTSPPPSPIPPEAPKSVPRQATSTLADRLAAELPLGVAEDLAPAKKTVAMSPKAEGQGPMANRAGDSPRPAPGGAIGSLSGAVAARPDALVAAAPAPSLAAEARAQERRAEPLAKTMVAPRWVLERFALGHARVTILAPEATQPVLLQRGSDGVKVLNLQRQGPAQNGLISWQVQVHLGPADALDLYLLDHPVAELSQLPATGPVGGFRARIHPPEK